MSEVDDAHRAAWDQKFGVGGTHAHRTPLHPEIIRGLSEQAVGAEDPVQDAPIPTVEDTIWNTPLPEPIGLLHTVWTWKDEAVKRMRAKRKEAWDAFDLARAKNADESTEEYLARQPDVFLLIGVAKGISDAIDCIMDIKP